MCSRTAELMAAHCSVYLPVYQWKYLLAVIGGSFVVCWIVRLVIETLKDIVVFIEYNFIHTCAPVELLNFLRRQIPGGTKIVSVSVHFHRNPHALCKRLCLEKKRGTFKI